LDQLTAEVAEIGGDFRPSQFTDTLSFDTTTLYGPDGSPVTIDTSTSAGVTRARDLIDTQGFTTVAPTAGEFDTTTLYSPDGRPVTINTGTAEGRARADELISREGFTTVAPTEGGFDTTTLYSPDGRPVTINTATPEGRTEANRLLTTEGFTTVAPTEGGFDTTTLYGPDGRPVTINTATPEGRAEANRLLTTEGFTTVAPTAEGFDTTTLYGSDGRPVTINTATPEGRAEANRLLTTEGFTTVAPTEEGFNTTTLYGSDGRPVTINTATPEGRAEANRLLTTEGFTTVAPTAEGFNTTTLYGPDGTPVTINTATPEGRTEANRLLTTEGFTTVAPEPAGAPATLVERQQAAITDQTTLDNLENLSPQDISRFAANAAAYIQETVGPGGVSARLPLPPNTQEAMRRAHAAGVSFPGIDSTLFGAPPTADELDVLALNILDPSTDLRAATGLLSGFQRGINLLGEQLADFVGGTGTAFVNTAEGSQSLKTLAAATNRFYLAGKTLALEFSLLQEELVRPAALRTDQDAIRALTNQRALLEGDLARVQQVLNNPRGYTNADISTAREIQTYAQQLLLTYDDFIQAYGGARTGPLPTLNDIMNNPANLIQSQ
jgi:hypothetical protein